MHLIQFLREHGQPAVARVLDHNTVQPLAGDEDVRTLALTAAREGIGLDVLVGRMPTAPALSYPGLLRAHRILPPLTHPEPSRMIVSGTGLTHWGSASSRAAMHAKLTGSAELTDSMRMFKGGVDGGHPSQGEVGFQPEWFYKGDGSIVVAPEHPIPVPAFAMDAGEEPELVGLYVIGDDGTPLRAGFAVGNEFSDHQTERFNYLWLAHSKLRFCSFGPELAIGTLAADLRGHSRIVRGNEVIWERPFLTGEANMCHSIANLEHHHFKYAQFRRPGDVHVHYFGTGTLSFADGVRTQEGDRFEIEQPALGRPLRNSISWSNDSGIAHVRAL